MLSTSKKSSNKTPWEFQKTARSTLPAEGVVLNFSRIGDDERFHSIDAAFVSGVKWRSHEFENSRHNLKQKVIAIFMVTQEILQAGDHALLYCMSGHPFSDTFLNPRMSLMIF
ncbi:hypothetical protein TNCT_143691 [Trichonephila clavata]|uniref:Uncharacterized protein n=1 Tax=Trichonephila clavata TaxID=2740835 RepID=A0A8X6HSC9_TRICU|nr:hypothetical protein TNCT_143691 [Trichonephila clavata]